MKRLKKLLIMVLAISLSIPFTACESMDNIIEKDVDLTKDVAKEDLTAGVYVLTADGRYFRPNTLFQSYTNKSNDTTGRFVFSVNGCKFIPKLYNDDKLVYFTGDELPENLTLETFAYQGFTLGVHDLKVSENGTIYLKADNLVSQTSAYQGFGSVIGANDTLTLDTFEGHKLTGPQLSSIGTLNNLDEGTVYTFGTYKGTFYNEVTCKADTEFWISSEIGTTNGFIMTTEGYALIDANLSAGFYSIDNEGLIEVVNENRSVIFEE